MAQMLADEDARRNLIEDVVEYAVQAHQAGIVVDFEGDPRQEPGRISVSLPPSSRSACTPSA